MLIYLWSLNKHHNSPFYCAKCYTFVTNFFDFKLPVGFVYCDMYRVSLLDSVVLCLCFCLQLEFLLPAVHTS